MIRIEVAFRLKQDNRFVVSIRPVTTGSPRSPVTEEQVFDDEEDFLRRIVDADLDQNTTSALVVAVIASVADPLQTIEWTTADVTEAQLAVLLPNHLATASAPGSSSTTAVPSPIAENASQFYDFLMNAPTPFVMLTGPELRFSFINPAYVELLGRSSSDELLGLPVREALPEPGFQHCLSVLKTAYETGTPQVRRELLNSFREQDTGLMVEVYFDIVYHPVHDPAGKVTGIMAQATDVTERVLSRQVSENREQKLFHLWAELEAIYSGAPVGIAVIESSEFKILRLNARQAEFFGAPEQELLNKPIAHAQSINPEVLELLHRAARGEQITDVRVPFSPSDESANEKSWLVSFTPSLDRSGNLRTITLTTLDISGAKQINSGSPSVSHADAQVLPAR